MTRHRTTLAALLIVAIVLLIAFGGRGQKSGRKREGYLIYPYLDLEEPGERGDYYSLQACP